MHNSSTEYATSNKYTDANSWPRAENYSSRLGAKAYKTLFLLTIWRAKINDTALAQAQAH